MAHNRTVDIPLSLVVQSESCLVKISIDFEGNMPSSTCTGNNTKANNNEMNAMKWSKVYSYNTTNTSMSFILSAPLCLCWLALQIRP